MQLSELLNIIYMVATLSVSQLLVFWTLDVNGQYWPLCVSLRLFSELHFILCDLHISKFFVMAYDALDRCGVVGDRTS